MKRMSFLLLIGLVVFALSVGYGAYSYWQKSSIVNDLAKIDSSLAAKKKQVLEYQSKNLLQAISAKQLVNELDEGGVKWSKVIKNIRATLPVKESGPLVEVLSYAASSSKAISLSVKTVPGSDTPYFDVARVIKTFDESEFFKDNFVPSISAGTDDEGREVLSFALLTNYSEPSVQVSEQEELTEALSTVFEESLSEPVPR